MRRGEIWRVTGLRADRLIVIVSADAVAEGYPPFRERRSMTLPRYGTPW